MDKQLKIKTLHLVLQLPTWKHLPLVVQHALTQVGEHKISCDLVRKIDDISLCILRGKHPNGYVLFHMTHWPPYHILIPKMGKARGRETGWEEF